MWTRYGDVERGQKSWQVVLTSKEASGHRAEGTLRRSDLVRE
jgi:hypothetical protein